MSGVVYFPRPTHSAAPGPLYFQQPRHTWCVHCLEDVRPALREVAAAAEAGQWAAGFLAYEAAPAFDPAFAVHAPGTLPLLWFGLYDAPEAPPAWPAATAGPQGWTPRIPPRQYEAALRRIRAHLAAGDTYQVNYTFPLDAEFDGDPAAWFATLDSAQPAAYSAYLDLGRHALCSVSPECFFTLEGDQLTSRPMKGTRPRSPSSAHDDAVARELAACEKDRAENVMIVDMIRNDLGRVCRAGSVHVPELFAVERYDTVWQMTSTVRGSSDAPLDAIFAALFPCASVTGAPKVETMRIIHKLEPAARGAYCGAIGWVGPGRRAAFSVGIRTATVDREARHATYPVGSGVTWDSQTAAEYEECLSKAVVVRRPRPAFRLLETLRYEDGFARLDGHLARLQQSAAYFGYACDPARVRDALSAATAPLNGGAWRVRLLLARDGQPTVETHPHTDGPDWRVGLAPQPVDPEDPFLYHKTTHRSVYRQALASRPDCDDVLLYTPDGHLTETCLGNVVLDLDGHLLTPPVAQGLLAGVMRGELLAEGRVTEAPLTLAHLEHARAIYVCNAVRGLRAVHFVKS